MDIRAVVIYMHRKTNSMIIFYLGAYGDWWTKTYRGDNIYDNYRPHAHRVSTSYMSTFARLARKYNTHDSFAS